MIIENQNWKFWVDDNIMNNPDLTLQQIQAQSIPYDLYLLQQELKQKQQEYNEIEAEPDMIEIPNEKKLELPWLQAEIEDLQNKINNYG